MTAPVTATSPLPTSAVAPRAEALGKEDFLKLLVTQLRNQDPLSPLDGAEFSAQLAQFSSVEQLISISEKLDSQAASAAEGTLSTQTMLGATMIGRDVTIRGSEVTADGSEPPRLALELGSSARDVTIEVFDKQGNRLGSQSFQNLAAGRATLSLTDIDLAPGTYRYAVTAANPDTGPVEVATFTIGRVTGMSFAGGEISLRIDGRLVPMLDVVEVLSVNSAASPNQESNTP